ncbi:MAG: ABC transporter ATP-binding protein [Alphaproteobacteria bacterium]|nr:ABC transporter ATP-binding protein [Alphaproteobacteria bacterium]
MLKVIDICKSFGEKQALENVSFAVKKGQVVALLGENGAGKSTLLRILSGFIEADCGAVEINDIKLSANRLEFLNHIGYVQEVSALYGEMNVFEYLKFVADIRQVAPEKQTERIRQVVDLLELKDVVAQKNDTLSKGYKKRTELAAVLLAEPDILLLDEPTEGLDPNQKFAIRKIIKEYAKGHAVILSTHVLEDVDAVADKVLLLHKGKLLIDAKLADFKKKTQNDLLESFRQITKK